MATTEITPSSPSKNMAAPKTEGAKPGRIFYEDTADQERIREVVAGSQLRDAERRYARFEERMLKELGNLRSEVTGRMGALEHHVHTEIDAIAARFNQESNDRQAADKQLGDDAHHSKTTLAKEVDVIRQGLAKSEREVRQSLLDAAKAWSTEVHRLHEDLSHTLSEDIAALEETKVAKAGLAAMLGDMIARLHGGMESRNGGIPS